MNALTQAYLAIFDFVPETCCIEKVRRISRGKNESGDNTYSYTAIVAIPVALPDMKADENDCVRVQQFAKRKLDRLGGPDVIHTVKYETDKGDEKKFNFACHLTPDNIQALEISDGIMRVTCKAYGTFF